MVNSPKFPSTKLSCYTVYPIGISKEDFPASLLGQGRTASGQGRTALGREERLWAGKNGFWAGKNGSGQGRTAVADCPEVKYINQIKSNQIRVVFGICCNRVFYKINFLVVPYYELLPWFMIHSQLLINLIKYISQPSQISMQIYGSYISVQCCHKQELL